MRDIVKPEIQAPWDLFETYDLRVVKLKKKYIYTYTDSIFRNNMYKTNIS